MFGVAGRLRSARRRTVGGGRVASCAKPRAPATSQPASPRASVGGIIGRKASVSMVLRTTSRGTSRRAPDRAAPAQGTHAQGTDPPRRRQVCAGVRIVLARECRRDGTTAHPRRRLGHHGGVIGGG